MTDNISNFQFWTMIHLPKLHPILETFIMITISTFTAILILTVLYKYLIWLGILHKGDYTKAKEFIIKHIDETGKGE